jgi:hypothetical protein
MACAFRAASGQGVGTTSVTISAPAGIQAFDLLLAFIVDHNTTSVASAAPSGWTSLGVIGGAAGRFQVFWMLYSSGASWTFTGLTTAALGEIVAYSGVDRVNPINGTASVRQNASGTTGTLSITPTVTAGLIVGGFCSYANGTTYSAGHCATNPSIMTKRFDSANGTACSMAIEDGTQNGNAGVATGDSSITMTTAGTNAGILFCLTPSPPVQLVQSKTALNNSSGTSTATTITASVAGNLIVVALAWDSAVTLTSVTDNLGNVYLIIGSTVLLSADSLMCTALLYIEPVLNTGGITSVTAVTSAAAHLVMGVLEFSGTLNDNSLDQSSRSTGTTANIQPGAITTTKVSELIISWIGIRSLTAPTSPAPYSVAGITQPAQFASDLARWEYQLTSFTGTFGAAGTWSSTNVTANAHLATFFTALPSTYSKVVTGAGKATLGGTATEKLGVKYTGTIAATTGGSDAYKVGSKYVATGGAVAGGTDAYKVGRKYTGAGAAVAGGTATFKYTTKATVTGAGGAVAGGTAAFKYTTKTTVTGAGGAVAGGTAAFILKPRTIVVGAGGAIAGGTATFKYTTKTTVTGAGGAVAGGTAAFIFKPRTTVVGAGKAVAGGAATVRLAVKFTGAGGAIFSGTAPVNVSGGNKFTGSGTITMSGTATERLGLKFTGAGAAVAGGADAYRVGGNYTGAGGAVAGGADVYRVGRNYTGAGGAVAAGTATFKYTTKTTVTGAGGALAGGADVYRVGRNYTGAGGAVAAGTATFVLKSRTTVVGAGGAVFAGADTYRVGRKYVGSGTITISGRSGTAVIGSGKITMGGTAALRLRLTYLPTGGPRGVGEAFLRFSYTFFLSGAGLLLSGSAITSGVKENYLTIAGLEFTAWTGSVESIQIDSGLDISERVQ